MAWQRRDGVVGAPPVGHFAQARRGVRTVPTYRGALRRCVRFRQRLGVDTLGPWHAVLIELPRQRLSTPRLLRYRGDELRVRRHRLLQLVHRSECLLFLLLLL